MLQQILQDIRDSSAACDPVQVHCESVGGLTFNGVRGAQINMLICLLGNQERTLNDGFETIRRRKQEGKASYL